MFLEEVGCGYSATAAQPVLSLLYPTVRGPGWCLAQPGHQSCLPRGSTMTGKLASYAFVTLLLFLPLRASGNLGPFDQAVSTFFDSALSPIAPAECGFEGPM